MRIEFDWTAAASKLKKKGPDEYHGPCPVTESGEDCFWVRPEKRLAGCRACSPTGAKLENGSFKDHFKALGAVVEKEPPPKPAPPPRGKVVARWTFTAANGKQRGFLQYEHGSRTWEPTKPANNPPPKDLLYYTEPPPAKGVVLLTEGAKDAQAALKAGMKAIGRPGSVRPSKASVERLPEGVTYLIVPDLDEAGRHQAAVWADCLIAAGRTARVVDLKSLAPDDAPSGYDLSDWLAGVSDAQEPLPVLEEAAREHEPEEEEIISERRLGLAFHRRFGKDLLFVSERKEWMQWSGREWSATSADTIQLRIAALGESVYQKRGRNGYRDAPETGGSARTAKAAAGFVRGVSGVTTHLADWDQQAGIVGMPDGRLLEVRGKTLRERDRRREDRVSLAMACRPARSWRGGRWEKTLELAFAGDPGVARALQEMCGRSLLGRGLNDQFIVAVGKGGTFKSSVLKPIRQAFGDYGATPPTESIISSRGFPQHSQRRVAYIGRRFALVSEPNQGEKLDTTFVKQITGGESFSARKMGENDMTTEFMGALVIQSNFEPETLAPDTGIDRRILLIRFRNEVEASVGKGNMDHEYRDTMPIPEVAAWLIEGAKLFLRDGPAPLPDSVTEASREWQKTSNVLSQFVDECCEIAPQAFEGVADLFAAYKSWCEEQDVLRTVSKITFSKQINSIRGVERHTTGAVRGFNGIRLAATT